MKKVLITGANSYIGTSFEQYVKEHYADQLDITTIDMVDGSWRSTPFKTIDTETGVVEPYDCVFHVAGIAHADVGKVTEDIKRRYYKINTDLAIETVRKAKEEGVKQLVFMSSAIVYGDSAPYGKSKRITADTIPHPSNFYGDSKWKADKGVRELTTPSFTVAVLRSPMIYGKGSRGNYPTLSKMARKLPVFPDVENERSMLYIENLCEFLSQVMIRGEGGIFWPQNKEYSRTSDLVRMIASVDNHKIVVSRAFNWIVELARIIPGKPRDLADKAFGNLSYDQNLSTYNFKYQIYTLNESIRRTER